MQVLDRWAQHTRGCAHCLAAVRALDAAIPALACAAAAAAVFAAVQLSLLVARALAGRGGLTAWAVSAVVLGPTWGQRGPSAF